MMVHGLERILKKAEVFAEHLSKVFESPNREITKEEENIIRKEIQENEIREDDCKSFKYREVNNIVKYMKIKKSPGYDQINGKMLKELPPKIIRFITIIMNATLRLQHFPEQWKVAEIILILKKVKRLN